MPLETFSDLPVAPIVLVDFARFSNEVTLVDLMRADAQRRGLYRIDGVDAYAAAGAGASVADVAAACRATLVDRGVRPAGLIGYCSAATLTLCLAAELGSGAGPPPALALVDPTWPDRELIRADLAEALAALDSGGPIAESAAADLPSALAVLRDALAAKLRADGTPDEEIDLCLDLMLQRYAAWFGFLFATRSAPPIQPPQPVLVLLSAQRNRRVPQDWPAGLVTAEPVPLSVAQMLDDEQVRQRLCAYVDAGARP